MGQSIGGMQHGEALHDGVIGMKKVMVLLALSGESDVNSCLDFHPPFEGAVHFLLIRVNAGREPGAPD